MISHCFTSLLLIFLVIGPCSPVKGFIAAFVPRQLSAPAFVSTLTRHRLRLQSTPTDSDASSTADNAEGYSILGVVAPLKYLGPYPCLALHFPKLATSEQRAHNQTGVTLDFVLDTGANVNTIDAKIAKDLNLPLVASSKDLVGSAGVGGTFQPGDIMQLGVCELDGLPPEQTTTFMTNLTAAALSHSTPIGNGILSFTFFLSFPAGVEFDWHGTDGDPPTIIFYYGKELPAINDISKGLVRVQLERLAVGILSLTINVNGTDMLAILDTGSPITVLNQEAAKQAGIETMAEQQQQPEWPHRQGYGDDKLMIGGADGVPVSLYRSVSPVSIRAGSVSLGEGPVYVGELPGLTIVGGLTGTSLPAVVLGLDSLRRTYRMILRAPENEVWFEELQQS